MTGAGGGPPFWPSRPLLHAPLLRRSARSRLEHLGPSLGLALHQASVAGSGALASLHVAPLGADAPAAGEVVCCGALACG